MQPRLFETLDRKALDGRRKQILDRVNGGAIQAPHRHMAR
jgi:hypothetical protein